MYECMLYVRVADIYTWIIIVFLFTFGFTFQQALFITTTLNLRCQLSISLINVVVAMCQTCMNMLTIILMDV